jgi:Fe-S-cluster containining protein
MMTGIGIKGQERKIGLAPSEFDGDLITMSGPTSSAYLAAYHATVALFKQWEAQQSPVRSNQAFSQLISLLDQLINTQPQPPLRACHKGCGWCCHQPVYVSQLEAQAIVHFIAEQWPDSWRAHLSSFLQQRIAERQDKGGDRGVLAHGVSCVFLTEENNCAIHAARPFACRGYVSSDARACADYYVDKTAPFPPIDPYPHETAKGLLHAIKQHLDQQPLRELHQVLLDHMVSEKSSPAQE